MDGPETLQTYLGALDAAYDAYRRKAAKFNAGVAAAKGEPAGPNGSAADPRASVKLDNFDYAIFHSPYSKLVQKGFGRVVSAGLYASRGPSHARHDSTYAGAPLFALEPP